MHAIFLQKDQAEACQGLRQAVNESHSSRMLPAIECRLSLIVPIALSMALDL